MGKRPSHTLLTPDAIADITLAYDHFLRQRTYAQTVRNRHSHGLSLFLARKYGVSQRAIRDVWNGQSWNAVSRMVHTQRRREGDATDLHWLCDDVTCDEI